MTGLFSARLVVELTPVPDSATVSGLFGALLLTDRVPDAAPAAVGANVTLTVQEAPAASEVPQLFDSPNGPVTPIEDIDTARRPGVADPSPSAPRWSSRRSGCRTTRSTATPSASRAGAPPPEPGKISNSDSCAADQPVLPVKLSSTYRSLVPDGRLIVTVFPVDGLNVYPADPTSG